jgi:hypothetical protein
MKLGLIVEGHGDVEALPILVRRLTSQLGLAPSLDIPRPLRLPRGKILKELELRRAVELMARKTNPDGAILVVCDADDDCPAEVGPQLLAWAEDARRDRDVAVVLAKFEVEAWFLAAAGSLRGERGLPEDVEPPADPEGVRDAKGWLHRRLPNGYSETIDEPALAALVDLTSARAAPSFEKLVRDLTRILGGERRGRGRAARP